jgi:Ni,Fe-hydrogenase maturation factor
VEGDIEVKDMKSESGEVSVIDTEKLKEYCAQQRHNLQVTENTKRMSVLGEDGKITNISDKDKEAKIQEIRANLQKYCQ